MKLTTLISVSALVLALGTVNTSARAEGAAPAADPSIAPIDNSPSMMKPAGVSGKDHYLLGVAALGPYVALSLPHPLRFGLEARTLSGYLGVSAEYGFLPSVSFGTSSANINEFSGRVMLFPWAEKFFLGAAIGRQSANASYTDYTVPLVPVTVSVSTAALMVTPMIGWRFEGKSGIVFGFDLGWVFPLSPASSVTSNPTNTALESTPTATAARSLANTIAGISLPYVTALHLGFRI